MGLLVRSVGTYADLPAASSIPAGTIVQVGNDPVSSLNGFYRSNGSSWISASGAPTGNAGGVLGYPGSTFPAPTGLAATVFGAPAEALLRIKGAQDALGAWKRTVFAVDNNDDQLATSVTLRAGSGSAGSWAAPTPGGQAWIEGGRGSPAYLGGPGGTAGVAGGDATGNNDGGDVELLPGQGSGSGIKGAIRLNGRARVLERLCYSAGDAPETVANGGQIGATGLTTVLHPIQFGGASCVLDASTPIAPLTANDRGQLLTVVNASGATITIPAGGNVKVQNGASLALPPFGIASFVWVTMGPGGVWIQITPLIQVG